MFIIIKLKEIIYTVFQLYIELRFMTKLLVQELVFLFKLSGQAELPQKLHFSLSNGHLRRHGSVTA